MTTEKKIKDVNALIEKFDALKKQEKMDLSSDQDLSIAIMNLISIEEHLAFSGGKTGKTHFYDLIEEVREMRKNLLKNIVKEPEWEVWCISKHLLAASMRLMEVGTKAQSRGKRDEAYGFFDQAYDLYALFWGLQMGVVRSDDVSRHTPPSVDSDENAPKSPEDGQFETSPRSDSSLMGRLRQFVRKSVDCCIE